MNEAEFPKEKIQQSFREHTRVLFEERLRVFCYFGVALLLLVGVLDLWVVRRELLPAYLSIRLATALILVGVVFFIHPALGKKFVRLWGMVGALLLGMAVMWCTSLIGHGGHAHAPADPSKSPPHTASHENNDAAGGDGHEH